MPMFNGEAIMTYGYKIEWFDTDISPSIERDAESALFVAAVPKEEWTNAMAFLLAGMEVSFTRGWTRSIRRVIVA